MQKLVLVDSAVMFHVSHWQKSIGSWLLVGALRNGASKPADYAFVWPRPSRQARVPHYSLEDLHLLHLQPHPSPSSRASACLPLTRSAFRVHGLAPQRRSSLTEPFPIKRRSHRVHPHLSRPRSILELREPRPSHSENGLRCKKEPVTTSEVHVDSLLRLLLGFSFMGIVR